MTADELRALLARGEGARLEWKRVLPRPDRAARTLAAFANGKGGLLVVGITDAGRVHGVHDAEAVMRALVAVGRTWVEPPLELLPRAITIDGPTIVACPVPASRARPHAAVREDGERVVFVRAGASNRPADRAALRSMARASGSRARLTAFERSVLAWIAARSPRPGSGDRATPERFAAARNVGIARARRAFTRLEVAGLVVVLGAGRTREWSAA